MKGSPFKEKREFMRADAAIEARAEAVAADEFATLCARKAALTSSTEPAPDLNAPLLLLLAQALDTLTHLESKVDRILKLLESDKGIVSNALTVEKTIDISGSGMRLILAGPVSKGQILHLSLFNPDFPLGMLKLYGEVTRLKLLREGCPPVHEAAVKFLELGDEEREAIIAYTFHLQRKRIRKTKDDD